MKTKYASAYQLLLAGLLALPVLSGAGLAGATELEIDAASGHPPMLPDGAVARRPDGSAPRSAGAPDAPHGRGEGPGAQGGMGAGHVHPPMDDMGAGPRPPFLHGLDLTEAQQDKVFAILHAQAPYLREQGKAAAKAHEALRAMGRAEQYDDAKAAALAKEAATAMANIALQHVRTEQKLLAVLSPEQRKKLAERSVAPQPRP
ncbi:Spy/CpxP family protein refolding chaperone [Duganella qianjiadongensis]|uniref:Periplasmic heavy metal sensor n=1 Tax=Duganella qianjiadongensis TaxID=2692176 RepID=A0ABW9VQ69_9BURK|nr:periplasmic heavy metal sensor [Duganella qianjiadongensis]MYM39842.1 periplasmic heavy metal sensor [Duganella qianjiadongensis]